MGDLKSLEAFVWIVRLGGFRAAAARLNTTQPSVSARIDQLEKSLGVTLFHPPRRTVLTREGEILLGYAERMVGLMSELRGAVAAPGAVSGLLRIGAVETLVHSLVPRLIQSINASHPNVTIDLMVDSTDALGPLLLEGKVDISMQVGRIADAGMITQPLCALPLAWLASPSLDLPPGPVCLQQMTRWPVISFSRNTELVTKVQRIFSASGVPGIRLWGSSSLTIMARLAMDGLASCIVPLATVRREVAAGQLRVLDVTDISLPPNQLYVSYAARPDNFLARMVADTARDIGASLEADGEADRKKLSPPYETTIRH